MANYVEYGWNATGGYSGSFRVDIAHDMSTVKFK